VQQKGVDTETLLCEHEIFCQLGKLFSYATPIIHVSIENMHIAQSMWQTLKYNLKLSCLHPVACIRSGSEVYDLTQIYLNSFYYFIQIICYMFRSCDHPQEEIYTSEINIKLN
jgi:hypothetical protein